MPDSYSPGQRLEITVKREPRAASEVKTIERLMRQDMEIKRALCTAQRNRRQNLYVRSRGKRPWEVRRRCARYASVHPGARWTMTFVPHLQDDLRSVQDHLEVQVV
jgi:hypothetical protein